MDFSESIRSVVTQELGAFLQQFRVDHEAYREADRRYLAEQIDALHNRIDRTERLLMSPNTSASTSITTSSLFSSHSPQGLGSPATPASTVAEPPADWGDRRYDSWNLERSFNAADADTSFGDDAEFIRSDASGAAFVSGILEARTDHDWGVSGAAAAGVPQQHPSVVAPAHYPQGLSSIDPAQTTAAQLSNVQFPLVKEMAYSFIGEHPNPAPLATGIPSSPGLMGHNPRVCALCRYAFIQTK
jgi:hypothetical protein